MLCALQSACLATHPWAHSPKRGVGLPLRADVQAANLLKLEVLEVPWFYSWAAEPLSGFAALPDGVDFVPMSWGRNAPANNQATWIAGQQAGLYDTLLGFNEPDLATQANMTVQEALERWPTLQATGLRLGSPAPANFNNGWITQFMDGVSSDANLHVDFIAMHGYTGADPQTLLDTIDGIYNTYGLPIWITEFAVRDGNAAVPADNIYTDQQVYNYMADVLPALESRSYVERYAWFPGERDNPFLTSSALFEDNGSLTKLGRLYVGEQETVPAGGMLSNPNFESSPLVAPTYQAAGIDEWTTINDADRSAFYAHTGRQSLRLEPGLDSGQSRPGIARQAYQVGVDVELAERYSLGAWVFHPSSDPLTGTREATLRIQWFDDGSLIGDQRIVALDASSPTDEWIFVTVEDVFIPNDLDVDEVRATLWVNNVGPTNVNSGAAYFDDIVFAPSLSQDLLGDFNGDAAVDGADYLEWQRRAVTNPFSTSDLAKWQASVSATQAVIAVPEPNGLSVFLVALFGTMTLRQLANTAKTCAAARAT
ncbi:MAG: glycosyl hydrolase [Planctomycetota bacterium]